MTRETFDYIAVGAGSAGCIVAHRLASRVGTRVLLLEAGPADSHWTIRMPGGLRAHYKPRSRYNWHFSTVAQPHLDGRGLSGRVGRRPAPAPRVSGMPFRQAAVGR